jgi:hypothetical protein
MERYGLQGQEYVRNIGALLPQRTMPSFLRLPTCYQQAHCPTDLSGVWGLCGRRPRTFENCCPKPRAAQLHPDRKRHTREIAISLFYLMDESTRPVHVRVAANRP